MTPTENHDVMNENHDAMDKLIVKSIGSVASKRAQMAQWDAEIKEVALRKAIAKRRRPVYWISAAACIAIICGVGISLMRPGSGNHQANNVAATAESEYSDYRGGFDDEALQMPVDEGNIDQVISEIDKALADTAIDPTLPAERQEYERALIAERTNMLMWRKINLLIQKGDRDEAIALLREFVKIDSQYSMQASQLLDDLTN